MTIEDPRTLLEALGAHARRTPSNRACVLLDARGDETRALTFAALDRDARALARALVARGLGGRRAVLAYEHGLDFVVALFAAMYAGIVAIPTPAPRSSRGRASARLASCCADARPSAILTTRALEPSLGRHVRGLDCVPTDAPLDGDAELPRVPPDAIAHVQYTSGSTSEPRGVELAHDGLVANLRMITEAYRIDAETVMLSWLPLFHDMGLVGFVLEPVWAGATTYLMPPAAFAEGPLTWLRAIDRHRAHLSAAPNSAYERCVEATTEEEREALDLSTWRVAINGAESVRADTVERFARAFAPAGFAPSAMRPSYGLAEVGLLVSAAGEGGARVETFAADAIAQGRVVASAVGRPLVSSGVPRPTSEVRIVDPGSRAPAEEGRLGEIWVSGPHVARGYLGREGESRDILSARLAGDAERAWLRTGDLGFFHGGELFVAGRRKELINVAGENHYPTDIEGTVARAHPALRALSVAAFGVEQRGEERLVVAAETRAASGTHDDVIDAIGRAVFVDHGIVVDTVVLVAPLALPRTSSGKLQRAACAERFARGLDGEIARASPRPARDDAHDIAPETPAAPARDDTSAGPGLLVQRLRLLAEWAFERDIESPRATLREIGGTSSQAVELLAAVEDELGVRLPFAALEAATTLSALAMLLARSEDARRWPYDLLAPVTFGGARTPLFVTHDALGGVTAARAIADALGGERPVFAVTPSRVVRTTRVAEDAAAQIARLQPRDGYLLYGEGLGVRLATAVASALERRGRTVALVARGRAEPPRVSRLRPREIARGLATQVALALRARTRDVVITEVTGPGELASALACADAARSRGGRSSRSR